MAVPSRASPLLTWRKGGARGRNREPVGSHTSSPHILWSEQLGCTSWLQGNQGLEQEGDPNPQGALTIQQPRKRGGIQRPWTSQTSPVALLAAHPLFQILRVSGPVWLSVVHLLSLGTLPPPHPQVPEAPGGISEGLVFVPLQEKVSPLLLLAQGSHGSPSRGSLPTWTTLSVLTSTRPALDTNTPLACGLASSSPRHVMEARHPDHPWS